MRRLLPAGRATRLALIILGAALGATLAVVVTTAVVSAQARRRLDARVAQLEQRLDLDRRRRMQLERSIVEERKRAAERRARREAELSGQLQQLKEEEARLREQLAEARRSASTDAAELGAFREKLQETRQRIGSMDAERDRAERTIRRYQAAVGLISGAWGWRDATGRSARYAGIDQKGEPQRDSSGAPLVTAEGEGPVIAVQFVGTGFVISPDGLVLTNRHIAEPWGQGDAPPAFAEAGFTPRLDLLEIFFPGIESPFPLGVVSVSPTADVALVKAGLHGRAIPVVELERDPRAIASGQPVVILGYPTGLDALLARVDEPLADEIVAKSRGDWSKIARELSSRGMIRPLSTQGHLGDVLPNQLVYDAITTQGGSGGPVFSQRGRAIALTSAVLSGFPAATFGVPIRFGVELLPPAPTPAARKGKGKTAR